MTRDPMHTSVCRRCGRGTWYSPERIEVSPAHDYKPAFVTDPARWEYGNKAHEHGEPGAMNLIPVDRSELAPQFASYYQSGERIRVRFSYEDDEPVELTGTVGKSTGWRPVYLLMRTSRSWGSSDVLGAADRVVAVKHGRTYRPTYQEVTS